MPRQFLNRDGSPDTSFGIRPVDPELGRTPGVTVRDPEDETSMPKAAKSGIYTLNGKRFKIRAGDVLPDGAVMDDEQRAKGPAPENRKDGPAPQNRAKRGKKDD